MMPADDGRFGLAAAGQHPAKRRAGPAGLTPREIEVLTLIARGASTRHKASLIGAAELQGTVPLWAWIGDEAATTFSY